MFTFSSLEYEFRLVIQSAVEQRQVSCLSYLRKNNGRKSLLIPTWVSKGG